MYNYAIMYPVLFHFGFVIVYTFGFSLMLATFVATFLIWRRARKLNFRDEDIIDLVLFSLFFALIFARIFYVSTHFSQFGLNFLKILVVTYFPGLDGLGALLGGVVGLLTFSKIKRWKLASLFDCVCVGLPLAMGVVSLGSFFSGNYIGKPSHVAWAVSLPGYSELRHPVALYWATFSFITFLIIVLMDRRHRKDGLIATIFFILLGLAMLLLENFSQASVMIGDVSLNQIAGVVILVLSVYIFNKLYKNIFFGDIIKYN